MRINRAWHAGRQHDAGVRSRAGRALAAGAVLTVVTGVGLVALAAPSSATTISPPGGGETLTINPGDTVRAGYDFNVQQFPQTGGAAVPVTVTVTDPVATFNVTCPNGSSASFAVPMPDYTVTVPVSQGGQWLPTGDQSSSAAYQGVVSAPNLCGGQPMHAVSQAIFTGDISSSPGGATINYRFHNSDNTSGSWSATNHLTTTGSSGSQQTLAGHIYSCATGSQTTTEVPGGTIGASGAQTVPTGPNPLGPKNVAAGGYTETATAPSGYQFVTCSGPATVTSPSTATENLTVPSGGSATGVFYVAPLPTTTCSGTPTVTGSITRPVSQGQPASATFTVSGGCTIQVSLISYTAPSSDGTPYEQQNVYDDNTGFYGPGTYTVQVWNPSCYYQDDLVIGPVIAHLSSTTLYSSQNRLLDHANGGYNTCSGVGPAAAQFSALSTTVSNLLGSSSLATDLTHKISDSQTSFAQGHLSDSCQRDSDAAQEIFSQLGGGNPQVTPAQALVLLQGFDQLASESGCGITPAQQETEVRLVDGLTTAATLGLGHDVAADVSQGLTQTGQDIAHGQASKTCPDLSQLSQRLSNDSGKATSSQLAALKALVADISAQAGC